MQSDSGQPEIIHTELEAPKPKPGLWGVWPTIGLGAAIFAIYFIAQSVVAIVFAVGQAISSSGNITPQIVTRLATNGNLISIATIVSGIFGLGFIFLFIKIRKGFSIKHYLGLIPISKMTLLGLVILIVILLVLSSVLDQYLKVPPDTGFTVDAYKTTTWPALLWIAVVVFAPAFEESFFRGFVFVGLKQSRIGAAGAVILTALTWAALHVQYDFYGMATILVLGIVFGIVRLKTGSLWSTIFLHSLWNTLAMVGTLMTVNGIIK